MKAVSVPEGAPCLRISGWGARFLAVTLPALPEVRRSQSYVRVPTVREVGTHILVLRTRTMHDVYG